MRKTRFDSFYEICQKLLASFSDMQIEELQVLMSGFKLSIEQINTWVSNDCFPATKSQIANGLEQGINELPLLFQELPDDVRSTAFQVYYSSVNSVIPGYHEKLRNRHQRILTQGKIQSDSDFYLLRNRLDKIEGNGTTEENRVLQLLGQYEAKA